MSFRVLSLLFLVCSFSRLAENAKGKLSKVRLIKKETPVVGLIQTTMVEKSVVTC